LGLGIVLFGDRLSTRFQEVFQFLSLRDPICYINARVKKEALQKHDREGALKARETAQKAAQLIATRARVEIAGEFGDKRLLIRLEELIENRPFDIVNLRLEVPTVKGARQKAPSYMYFEVTSEQQEAIAPFLEEVKKLIHDAGLVLVSATPVA
jgi:hypothetical protein